MKKVMIGHQVHLCLFALRDISVEDEIRYDYGPGGTMPWKTQIVKPGDRQIVASKSEILSPAFVKFEDIECCYKPHSVQYENFPEIHLDGNLFGGIFSCSKKLQNTSHTKATKVGNGYCECCNTYYSNLQSHINGFQHRMFVITEQNYAHLDAIIHEVNIAGVHSECTADICESTISEHDRMRLKPVEYNTTSDSTDVSVNVRLYDNILIGPVLLYVVIVFSL